MADTTPDSAKRGTAPAEPSGTDEILSEGFTGGVIIYSDVPYLVTIYRSILVMDTRRWALAQSEAHMRDASTATTESSRILMESIGRNLRLWATREWEFVESGNTLWQCSIPLAIRAKIDYLEVTQDNFDDYMAEVMNRTFPARLSITPTFLFLSGPGQPELYATESSAYMAEFVPGWIYGRVVSKDDLLKIYERVAKEYPDPRNDRPLLKPGREQNCDDLMKTLVFGTPNASVSFSQQPVPMKKRSDKRKKG